MPSCAVYGCTNNYKNLKKWLDGPCVDHLPLTKRHCGCPRRFRWYLKPREDAASRAWLQNLNLRKPPKRIHVCSFHFVDNKPTPENPYPELYLGYERKVTRRRVLKRCVNEHVSEQEEAEKKSKKKGQRQKRPVVTSRDRVIKSSDRDPQHASGPQRGEQVKVECESSQSGPPSASIGKKGATPRNMKATVCLQRLNTSMSEEEGQEFQTKTINLAPGNFFFPFFFTSKQSLESSLQVKTCSSQAQESVRQEPDHLDPDQSLESVLQVKMSSASQAGTDSFWDHDYCRTDQPVESRPQVIQQKRNHLGVYAKPRVLKHICDQCGKICGTRQNLTTHQRTHTGERPYQCDQCGITMKTINVFKDHLLIHTGVKAYHCYRCEKRFRTTSSLRSHMKIHSAEKPYRCDQCEFSCRYSFNLKSHMRRHTGEKPYQCPLCGQRFSQLSGLKGHQKSHTKKEKNKPCARTLVG